MLQLWIRLAVKKDAFCRRKRELEIKGNREAQKVEENIMKLLMDGKRRGHLRKV